MSFPAELDHPEYQEWLHALSTLEAEMQKQPRASNVEACLSTLTQQRFFPWQLSLLLGRLSLQALQKGGQQTKINTSINRAAKKIRQQLARLPKAQVAKVFEQELAQLKVDIAQGETHFTALEQFSHFYRPFVDAASLTLVKAELAEQEQILSQKLRQRGKSTNSKNAGLWSKLSSATSKAARQAVTTSAGTAAYLTEWVATSWRDITSTDALGHPVDSTLSVDGGNAQATSETFYPADQGVASEHFPYLQLKPQTPLEWLVVSLAIFGTATSQTRRADLRSFSPLVAVSGTAAAAMAAVPVTPAAAQTTGTGIVVNSFVVHSSPTATYHVTQKQGRILPTTDGNIQFITEDNNATSGYDDVFRTTADSNGGIVASEVPVYSRATLPATASYARWSMAIPDPTDGYCVISQIAAFAAPTSDYDPVITCFNNLGVGRLSPQVLPSNFTGYQGLLSCIRVPPKLVCAEQVDTGAVGPWGVKIFLADANTKAPLGQETEVLPNPAGDDTHPVLAHTNNTNVVRLHSRRANQIVAIDVDISGANPSAQGSMGTVSEPVPGGGGVTLPSICTLRFSSGEPSVLAYAEEYTNSDVGVALRASTDLTNMFPLFRFNPPDGSSPYAPTVLCLNDPANPDFFALLFERRLNGTSSIALQGFILNGTSIQTAGDMYFPFDNSFLNSSFPIGEVVDPDNTAIMFISPGNTNLGTPHIGGAKLSGLSTWARQASAITTGIVGTTATAVASTLAATSANPPPGPGTSGAIAPPPPGGQVSASNGGGNGDSPIFVIAAAAAAGLVCLALLALGCVVAKRRRIGFFGSGSDIAESVESSHSGADDDGSQHYAGLTTTTPSDGNGGGGPSTAVTLTDGEADAAGQSGVYQTTSGLSAGATGGSGDGGPYHTSELVREDQAGGIYHTAGGLRPNGNGGSADSSADSDEPVYADAGLTAFTG